MTESRIAQQAELIESLIVNAESHIANTIERADKYEKRMYELAEDTDVRENSPNYGAWLAEAVVRYRLAQRMVEAAEALGQAVETLDAAVPNNERLGAMFRKMATVLDAWDRLIAATEALDTHKLSEAQ